MEPLTTLIKLELFFYHVYIRGYVYLFPNKITVINLMYVYIRGYVYLFPNKIVTALYSSVPL